MIPESFLARVQASRRAEHWTSRLPWWRRRTPEPVPEPHRPPEPVSRAERCGVCDDPITPAFPSMHLCSNKCIAAWNARLVAEPRNDREAS